MWLFKYFQTLKNCDSDAQTEILTLPKKGIISHIDIEFQATAGTVNVDQYLADAVTKIEIIGNGSTVIQSLKGRQIQASQAYDDNQLPPDKEYSVSGNCYGHFDIRFGRYPGDPKYALDCSKWDSLELKITYDLAAGGTMGTTGFTTATGKWTAYGLFSLDGAGLSVVGYLQKSQKLASRTTVATTQWDLKMPTDFPFRRLMLFNETKLYHAYQLYQAVTVVNNTKGNKPVDNMLGHDLLVFDQAIRGNPVFRHCKRYYLLTTGTNISPPVGWVREMVVTGIGGVPVSTTIDPQFCSVAMSVAGQHHVDFAGHSPWRSLAIDLERQANGKDGADAMMAAWGAANDDDIDLLWTEGTSALIASVVLEQYAAK